MKVYSTHPEFRAAFQERHKESAADPRAPPDIPKLNWRQQRQRRQRQLGHLNRPEENPNFDRAGMTSVRIDHMETSVEGTSAHAALLIIVGCAERSLSSAKEEERLMPSQSRQQEWSSCRDWHQRRSAKKFPGVLP